MSVPVRPSVTPRPVELSAPPPFVFFTENDVLRLGLLALNVILASYCTALAMLLLDGACTGASASFYCDPQVQTTRFGLAMRRLHVGFALYFAVTSCLLRWPRRPVVLLNVCVMALFGGSLVALGLQQWLLATASAHATTTSLVGVQLVLLGVTACVGGGYGGWRYHRRRLQERRVLFALLFSAQE